MTAPTIFQRNLASAAFLALATVFAVYRWHFGPATEAAEGLKIVSEMLRLEAIPLATKALEGGTKGATVPELLAAIQEAASQNQVVITSALPDPSDPLKITLKFSGEYRDGMLFLGRLETFQVSIGAFEIAPSPDGAMAGSIELRQTGKPGAPNSFADYLEAILKFTAVRNPFQIGDPVPLPNAGNELGDLSWTYRLTSISLYGAIRVATIDGRDYRVGDKFNGMEITSIGPSSVSLNAPGKPLAQKIHFRNNPKGGADEH